MRRLRLLAVAALAAAAALLPLATPVVEAGLRHF
jgi:hypothetical protein